MKEHGILSKSYLTLRADGKAWIGTGHVMRCLSLALGWERLGGKGLFVLAKKDAGLEAGLAKAGFEVARLATSPGGADDARATAELALSRKAAGEAFSMISQGIREGSLTKMLKGPIAQVGFRRLA